LDEKKYAFEDNINGYYFLDKSYVITT